MGVNSVVFRIHRTIKVQTPQLQNWTIKTWMTMRSNYFKMIKIWTPN